MRFHLTPEPLLFLITTFLLTPRLTTADPRPHISSLNGFNYNDLSARWECNSGTKCGYYGQVCCKAGSACYTNAKDEAVCTPAAGGGGSSWAPAASISAAPSWSGSAAPSGSANARCNYALSDSPCGGVCCKSTEYCAKMGTCSPAYGKQTTATGAGGGGGGRPGASPGIVVTSVSGSIVTQTVTPSSAVPYETPVATGANITMSESHSHGGLSGGAIAGIVIGVLLAIALLGLICFICCIKGLLDGCMALFGIGRKRRKVTEVDEYTRRSHHSSGGKKRTWYGAPVVVKKDKRKEKDSNGMNLLALGGGLAGLWAILGLKRRREDRRNHEKYSEYSYSSDYYTSSSE